MTSSSSAEAPLGVIVNPVHRSGRAGVAAVRRAAARLGRPVEVVETTIADPGAAQARALVAAGARDVVVVGGDGTVREVSHALAGIDVSLGIVPTGTANLIGRNLRLPRDRDAAAAVAVAGRVRHFDLGMCRTRDVAGAWSPDVPFWAFAGIGEDAAAVADTRPALKRRIGWLAYFESGLRHLVRRPSPMMLGLDDQARPVQAWSILVGNVDTIPGGIRVFPEAISDDGRLEVLTARMDHPGRWPLVALQGVVGRTVPGSGLTHQRAEVVAIRPAAPAYVQLDGDVLTEVAEVRFWVRQRAVGVRIPNRMAGRA